MKTEQIMCMWAELSWVSVCMSLWQFSLYIFLVFTNDHAIDRHILSFFFAYSLNLFDCIYAFIYSSIDVEMLLLCVFFCLNWMCTWIKQETNEQTTNMYVQMIQNKLFACCFFFHLMTYKLQAIKCKWNNWKAVWVSDKKKHANAGD